MFCVVRKNCPKCAADTDLVCSNTGIHNSRLVLWNSFYVNSSYGYNDLANMWL